ncbi:MAG: S1C family serine protease [Betaproteobacteria bacterium]|jgi:S1-C subfamily serine protease
MSVASVVVGGLIALLACGSAGASGSGLEVQSRALQRASDAVVGLTAKAVEDARSSATLGVQRQGSGVVISADGLVLTIGYLILEAEDVEITTDDGRQLPARVVAFDLATGFGLVQALVPMKLEPAPLGDAAGLNEQSPVVVVSGGQAGAVSMARLVSRRPFSGNWEYHIDGAIFTAPARRDHSGAGLFNDQGELIGIGSLWVADALGMPGVPRQQGNMFVPVDLLKPVLQDMRARGVGPDSQRAWLGLQAGETAAGLRVLRVNEDSPADVAGLEAGDTILAIDGQEVRTLEALWKRLWTGGPPERDVQLQVLRQGRPLAVTVHSVDRMKALKRPGGV